MKLCYLKYEIKIAAVASDCDTTFRIIKRKGRKGEMKEVQLDKLPPCEFCKAPAEYDAPTVFGPWAYMCEGCLAQYACGDPARIGSKITAKEDPK